jgi:hypothetical protein
MRFRNRNFLEKENKFTLYQALKRFRPLARRRFIIRRPAFVDILFRNPCVRARFIRLG